MFDFKFIIAVLLIASCGKTMSAPENHLDGESSHSERNSRGERACANMADNKMQIIMGSLQEMEKPSKDGPEQRRIYEREMLKIMKIIGEMSEVEKRDLYKDLARKIDKTAKDPMANSDEWTLIGILLKETKDNELIYSILLNTPPSVVGFVPLHEYLPKVPGTILSKLIRDAAGVRGGLDFPFNFPME